MPTPQKEKVKELCPNCFLFEQIEEPLIFRPGSDFMHHCGRGHKFEDKEALENLKMQMVRKRAAIERARNPEPEPETKPDAKLPQLLTGKGIIIEKDDQTRIQSILGAFTDASSLYGALFSLNEELQETKQRAATLESARQAMGARPGAPPVGQVAPQPNGDVTIVAIVPERFVTPLKDIAESNGMTVEEYYNSVIDNAFENGWFF